MDETVVIWFRVSDVFRNSFVSMYFDQERVLHRKDDGARRNGRSCDKKDSVGKDPALKEITFKDPKGVMNGMEERELVCIGCPMGCMMTITLESGAVIKVLGNTCQKGGSCKEGKNQPYPCSCNFNDESDGWKSISCVC